MWNWLAKRRTERKQTNAAPSPPTSRSKGDSVATGGKKVVGDAVSEAPQVRLRRRRLQASQSGDCRRPRCCRLDAMPLEQVRPLVPGRMVRRLKDVGIETVGDLYWISTRSIVAAMGGDPKLKRRLNLWRLGLSLVAEVPEISFRDVRLLLAIHRETSQALAMETPQRLHADLRRMLQTSNARRRFPQVDVPSLEQVREWVASARRRYGQTC